MTTTFLTPDNLSGDFIVQNGELHRVINHRHYTCILNSSTRAWNADDSWRKQLTLSDNIGIIHIDFKRTVNGNGTIATLPEAAPTPTATLEIQTWDGGNIYIEAGSRTVTGDGLTANRRYIVNLIGFFQ